MPLLPVRQRSGKTIHVWAVKGDCDPSAIRSNTFAMEWRPRSGRQAEFPEVDRAQFFPLPEARKRINPGQAPLLDELQARFGDGSGGAGQEGRGLTRTAMADWAS